MRTQWREGMGGRTGLDYAGVRAFIEMEDLDDEGKREAFRGVRACEQATLEAWAEQREK